MASIMFSFLSGEGQIFLSLSSFFFFFPPYIQILE